MPPRLLTPAQAARRAIHELRAGADPVRRDGMRAYFKAYESPRCFGVATPEVKRIGRGLHTHSMTAWTLTDAIGFCDRFLERQRPRLLADTR